MTFLLNLALRWGFPKWLARAFSVAVPGLLAAGLLASVYFAIRSAGEKAGEARATAKAEQAHARAVSDARQDERAAQGVADHIGAITAKKNDAASALVDFTVQEIRNEIDAAPSAPAGAAAPAFDGDGVRDHLNALIDRANRAADAAGAQP